MFTKVTADGDGRLSVSRYLNIVCSKIVSDDMVLRFGHTSNMVMR
jgi:hypothetical protein